MATCTIEGCKCSTSKWGDDTEWVCQKHWRIVCPPRSRERRLYHAWHRKGRKLGWPKELRARYYRFWDALIARGRKRCAGDLDMTEINKMFGWTSD